MTKRKGERVNYISVFLSFGLLFLTYILDYFKFTLEAYGIKIIWMGSQSFKFYY